VILATILVDIFAPMYILLNRPQRITETKRVFADD
jgi:hypothetical protein